MIKDHGFILRSIPYSDSAHILHCFTENHGLLALFTRVGKKRLAGHLQSGAFVEFAANEKPGTDLLTTLEVRWDPNIPTDRLSGEGSGLWLFTVELLQRSLKERLILPALYHKTAMYYGYLSQDQIPLDPIIPMVMVSNQLGLADLGMVFKLAPLHCQKALQTLGIGRELTLNASAEQGQEVFNIELHRFQQHFGIEHLGSLDLIGP